MLVSSENAPRKEENLLFQPVGHDNTKDVECEFDGDELTTRLVLGSFGGPDRDDSVENSSTPTVDETS